MRAFSEIERELRLDNYVGSFSGNLHITPVAPGVPLVVVRRFDRDLPASLIPAYASLLSAAQEWIERNPELARLVRVEQPTEVGTDFIARKHYLGTSLSAYASDEDPPEPPEELDELRSRFRERAAEAKDARERLIADVLARSILEPTSKTVLSSREDKFVIADLKPTREDLEHWSALTGAAAPQS